MLGLYKKEWYSGNTSFSETIPKVVWLKIERGKVKNTRNNAYSPTGDIFLRDTAYFIVIYASVKLNLELPLLKGRRRFDVETTSNLEVYIFRGRWILT